MLPFRGGIELLTARVPAAGRAWQEAMAAGRVLAWVTLLLLAAAACQPRVGMDVATCDHGARVLTG